MKSKMSFLSLLLLSASALAQPKFESKVAEGPGLDSACLQTAFDLVERYTEIVALVPRLETIRFLSFKNTTPGSYNQEYSAQLELVSSVGVDSGTNVTRLDVTFASPFICENLQIASVTNLGVQINNPLYSCLHDEAKFGPLNAAAATALDALQAYHAPCESRPAGAERVTCFNEMNGTSHGRFLLSEIRTAQANIKAAQDACRLEFPSL